MNDEGAKKSESALHVVPGVTRRERVIKLAKKRPVLSVEEYAAGVLDGNRAVLGRALTLMESANPAHRQKAEDLLEKLRPHSGGSIRLGISGIPGVGKSTFIEALGMLLVNKGHRVAVLAIDPSSEVSGGSIMGDKTRMEQLARSPRALVRPSAGGGWLGGVARGTREQILVCEAAGFDVVIVETIGVGQSETQVSSMVDFFLLLMVAGAGDELQGIKRGIIEMADGMAVNKADGDNIANAQVARAQYDGALRLLRPVTEGWHPRVLTCSAATGDGIDQIWKMVLDHHALLEDSGQLAEKRRRQTWFWMKQAIEYFLVERFYTHPDVAAKLPETKERVLAGEVSPFVAAERLVALATGAGETLPVTDASEREKQRG
ncbi:MAG: GTPase [Candidatus Sumerlaeota bacterium]|nr:GTPase [Candidatus Sumerlaeota bacterium]